MMRRLTVLIRYFTYRALFSLTGIIYVGIALLLCLGTFVFSSGFSDWVMRTGIEFYMIAFAVFGGVYTFVGTMILANVANQTGFTTFLVRLPSRVEYITAVFLGAVSFSTLVQFALAVLVAVQHPKVYVDWQLLDMPPVWISVNLLGSMFALHASDLVTRDWSRTYIYATVAFFLFTRSDNNRLATALSGVFRNASSYATQRGWEISHSLRQTSNWLAAEGDTFLQEIFGFVFWPFSAIWEAAFAGFFTRFQVWAPAVILLYALLLFFLAAEFFVHKDIHLVER